MILKIPKIKIKGLEIGTNPKKKRATAKIRWVRKEKGKMFKKVRTKKERAKKMKQIWREAKRRFG